MSLNDYRSAFPRSGRLYKGLRWTSACLLYVYRTFDPKACADVTRRFFMKRFSSLAVILALAALVVTPALADTLVLKNGTRVTGYYEGGTPRVVKFRDTSGTLKDYDIISVEQVVFEDVPTPVSTAPAPAPAPAAAAEIGRASCRERV